MKRKQGTLTIGLSAALASAVLSGCSSSSHHAAINNVGVCVDQHTHKRLPDADCTHTSHTSMSPAWVYYGMGRNIPAVGGYASGYSTREPRGYYERGGFSPRGGSSSQYAKLSNPKAGVYGGSDVRAHGGADSHGAVKGGSIARGVFGGHGSGGHGG